MTRDQLFEGALENGITLDEHDHRLQLVVDGDIGLLAGPNRLAKELDKVPGVNPLSTCDFPELIKGVVQTAGYSAPSSSVVAARSRASV